jgi:hypothetical protein
MAADERATVAALMVSRDVFRRQIDWQMNCAPALIFGLSIKH